MTEDRKAQGIIPTMNVRENASIAFLDQFAEFFGIDESREIVEVQSSVSSFQIKTPTLDTRIINLSGGNQQKVLLARSLMKKIRILILDEPTRGIDVGAKQEIYAIMNSLVATGVSIIMVSSELPEVLGMCDRVLVMCRRGDYRRVRQRAEGRDTGADHDLRHGNGMRGVTMINEKKALSFDLRKYMMVIALVGIWAIFGAISGGTYLLPRNMSNLFRQSVFTAILAIGMLNVIVLGQIDLSVGSIAGLCGGILAIMNVWKGLSPFLSIAIALGPVSCWVSGTAGGSRTATCPPSS